LFNFPVELFLAYFTTSNDSILFNIVNLNISESHDWLWLSFKNILNETFEPSFWFELGHQHKYFLWSVYDFFNFAGGIINAYRQKFLKER